MPKNPAKPAPELKHAIIPSGLPFQRILVPIDFSETSIKALGFALGIAQKLGGSVLLVYVYEPPSFMAGYHTLPITISLPDDEAMQKARIELDSIVPPDLPPTVKIQSFVRNGKPYLEITKLAEEQNVDAIVISTHGYTGLKHTILGSTTERVVRHAPCPVLVVR